MTSDYAVPQKRKRVIIICTRNDMEVTPGELFPEPITSEESNQVTTRDTIADLETVPCDDNAKYVEGYSSDILEFFKGHITYEEYVSLKSPDSEDTEKEQGEEQYEQLSLVDLL